MEVFRVKSTRPEKGNGEKPDFHGYEILFKGENRNG